MKKYLIKNGTIIDGMGGKPYKGDILFNEHILEVSKIIDESKADEVIDVMGFVVAPGFIDLHSHADLSVIEDKEQRFAIQQGITTQVVGLCGLGFVPLSQDKMIETMKYNAGLFGYKKNYENWDFTSFQNYMQLADHAATNIAVSATHNAAIVAVSGYANNVENKKLRINGLNRIIEEAMDAGCIGMSTGLSYYPCANADYDELKALATTIRKRDGIFLMHIRYPKPDNPYGALDEVIRLGLETKCKIHILHYRTKYPLDYGHPEILLDMVRKANMEGGNFTLETLPYLSGSTFIHTILPAWVVDGGVDKTIARLLDKSLRAKIIEEMQYLLSITAMGNGKPPRFGHVGGHPEYGGKFIRDVAGIRNQGISEMLIDLMVDAKLDINYVGNEAEEDPVISSVLMNDIMTLLQDPLYLVGSDTMPYGEYPHPRSYGCYVKMLRLARERSLPLEKIIAKITCAPAKRIGLKDRGVLEKNRVSDIVIFNPNSVRDNASFANPKLSPSGIYYVFVNGSIAVVNNVESKIHYGKIIRK
jgi:N-acyl-D-amino-acid deacylase